MSDSDSSDDDLAGVFTAFDIVKTDDLADSEIVKQNLATKRKVHDAYAAGPTPAERDKKKIELLKRRKRPMRDLMEDESDYADAVSSPAKRNKSDNRNIFEDDTENVSKPKSTSSTPALKPLKKLSKEKSLKPLKSNSFSETKTSPKIQNNSKKSAPAMDMGVIPAKKAQIPSKNADKAEMPEGESAVCSLSGIVLRNDFDNSSDIRIRIASQNRV